ncbi:hypothetical protein, partial [Yersinia pestis]|uniref:hypothetical protein n=1 Tax=Yersinia pestis TaxID=632 RepID=UPI001C48E692
DFLDLGSIASFVAARFFSRLFFPWMWFPRMSKAKHIKTKGAKLYFNFAPKTRLKFQPLLKNESACFYLTEIQFNRCRTA